MNVGQAMLSFFQSIWDGLRSVNIPYFNISLASVLLGMFVLDFSIGILFSLIRFYGSVSHNNAHIGSRIYKSRVRASKIHHNGKKGGK